MLDQSLVDQIPADLTVDVDGKAVPLRETPFVKEAKDFQTFVKGAYDAHREVGARIPIRTDGKPESVKAWRETHLPNLYKAGLLDAPPSSPKDYGVVKPTNIPPGLSWDDTRAEKYAGILHKYGVPKAIVPELMALHEEALVGVANALKTSVEEGTAALKREFGDKYDERIEQAKRLTAAIFKSPEELAFFEELGLGDHPGFLSVIMRLAPLAMQDSSIVAGMGSKEGGTGMSGDAVRAEVADIMHNKNNPKNAGYWRQDKAVLDYVEELYKKAYGAGTVDATVDRILT